MTPFSILNSQFSIPLLLLLLCGGGAATAQTDSEAALKEIEANNTTLRALRGEVEAQKLENQTGLYLPGPEVAFDYLWGNPAPIGSRTDVRVTQSFDLPTLAGMKSRLAAGRNRLAELQYRAERMRLLLEASLLCVDMIYCNALHRLLEERLEQATALAQSCETRLKAGDISLPEHNKAMLNLSAARAGLLRAEAERQSVTAELRRMNGGMEVTVGDDRYPAVSFPPHFEDWYAEAEQQHPLLACVRQETENGRRQIGLSKAATWPVLSAGYMSEKVLGQQYQGITLGLSIPLWENRNRVRQAQAAARAAEYRQTDRRE
ncbi:MAG: TolC family protein, partial [Tannerella sp.]|nr:TolC family protein [Tannerella sp.]